MTNPTRVPNAASLETVLAGLDPASADADLVPALARAFPGFEFRNRAHLLARLDHSVEGEIGQAMAAGLRVRPPHDDARGLLPWATNLRF